MSFTADFASREFWDRPRGGGVSAGIAEAKEEVLRAGHAFSGFGKTLYKNGRLVLLTVMALGVARSAEFSQSNTREALFPSQDLRAARALTVKPNRVVRAADPTLQVPRGESITTLSTAALTARDRSVRTHARRAPGAEISSLVPDANAAVVPFVTSDGARIFRAQDGKFFVLGSTLQEATETQRQEFLNQNLEVSFD